MPLLAFIFATSENTNYLMLSDIAMNNRSPKVRDREGIGLFSLLLLPLTGNAI